MLLDFLSPSLASYCFRMKYHVSETALNSQFSTLAYFEYFISCIELSFSDIGTLNSVWTMCCHTCFHVSSPLWKVSPISSSCHSFRIQHIPLPGDILSIRRFSVLGSLHFKYFWLKYYVDMEYSYIHYPLSPLYCDKFLERKVFGRFISVSQNLAYCLTA